MANNNPTPIEQPVQVALDQPCLTLGIPSAAGNYERRSLLTPEAVAILTDRGVRVLMQEGAGRVIHYTDEQYTAAGATIAGRAECMRADMVLHPAPIAPADARAMRRAGMLLTFYQPLRQSADAMSVLLEKHITAIALDLIGDGRGNRPFADILDEIDGRAAMALASSLLADAVHGKGILIGGVSGVIPCEVTVIGSNIAARAAARSALGMGAIVRMFDHDVYSLREAMDRLGPGVAGSALHPRVLAGALRSADVIVATPVNPPCSLPASEVEKMKRGVITFDIAMDGVPGTFPTLPRVDLADASAADNNMEGGRVCYVNPGNAVPRTAAMALSNTFLAMVDMFISSRSFNNALQLNPGLRAAALTFLGKPVNEAVAKLTGSRFVDINLLLQFS